MSFFGKLHRDDLLVFNNRAAGFPPLTLPIRVTAVLTWPGSAFIPFAIEISKKKAGLFFTSREQRS